MNIKSHGIPDRFAGRAIQNIELDSFRNDFSQPEWQQPKFNKQPQQASFSMRRENKTY